MKIDAPLHLLYFRNVLSREKKIMADKKIHFHMMTLSYCCQTYQMLHFTGFISKNCKYLEHLNCWSAAPVQVTCFHKKYPKVNNRAGM